MSHLSEIGSRLSDYVRAYPITIAIRTTAVVFFLAIAFVSAGAAATEGFAVFMIVFGYLIVKVHQFLGRELGGRSEMYAFPYQAFEVVWYILSWPSEVPDRES